MESGNEEGIEIREASEEDWPWMKESTFEVTVATLGPERAGKVTREKIMERIEHHFKTMRSNEELRNNAFIAHSKSGKNAGFVWVGVMKNIFTGDPEGVVLDLFVVNELRGMDIGKRLIDRAESYARSLGMKRMALSVGVHNTAARYLYDSLGYQLETMRLSKEI